MRDWINLIHALLTKHMRYVAHLVMLNVVGQANDLIPKTAEELLAWKVCAPSAFGVGE